MTIPVSDSDILSGPALRPGAAELYQVMREDIRNNGGWTKPGARAMVVYRFGAWVDGWKPGLARRVMLAFWRRMHRYVRNAYGIEIYSTANIGRGVVIGHQNGIVIHEFATIGDGCTIRQGVTLGMARSHMSPTSPENAPVLGRRVDIGAGAVIMGSVRIGDDVRIFPNAVVLTNVPDNTTVMTPTSRLISMGGDAPSPGSVSAH